MTLESDRDFLLYVDLHSETERALFSREHANRLLKLAGEPEQADLPALVSINWRHRRLIERAKQNAKQAELGCGTCGYYCEVTTEDGVPCGYRCFNPACHGPDSQGVNRLWKERSSDKW